MAIRKTVSDVSADLREHEAKCEERWKTIFAETEEIKKEINDLNKTIRIATFGSIGFLSTLLIALVSGTMNI
jgi:chaperonin cofactor prefoldin|tara:strand:- start:1356 stop:1571 length:216 start_codon:yes stop_codon:yes gene_type:complete